MTMFSTIDFSRMSFATLMPPPLLPPLRDVTKLQSATGSDAAGGVGGGGGAPLSITDLRGAIPSVTKEIAAREAIWDHRGSGNVVAAVNVDFPKVRRQHCFGQFFFRN